MTDTPERQLGSEGSVSLGSMPAEVTDLFNRVIDTQRSVVVTRGGKMAAMIIPMTAPELVTKFLAKHPEANINSEEVRAMLVDGRAKPVDESFFTDAGERTGELDSQVLDEQEGLARLAALAHPGEDLTQGW